MTGDMRAQRREPCDNAFPCAGIEWWESRPTNACPGCNNDGTRWVTIGTLREWTGADVLAFDGRRALVVERCDENENIPDDLDVAANAAYDAARSEVVRWAQGLVGG